LDSKKEGAVSGALKKTAIAAVREVNGLSAANEFNTWDEWTKDLRRATAGFDWKFHPEPAAWVGCALNGSICSPCTTAADPQETATLSTDMRQVSG
jgi:hypothetical protein